MAATWAFTVWTLAPRKAWKYSVPPSLRRRAEHCGQPSLRKLTWENGAIAWLYSAAEPETLRGPQHSHAWCDEIAKWARVVKASGARVE